MDKLAISCPLFSLYASVTGSSTIPSFSASWLLLALSSAVEVPISIKLGPCAAGVFGGADCSEVVGATGVSFALFSFSCNDLLYSSITLLYACIASPTLVNTDL